MLGSLGVNLQYQVERWRKLYPIIWLLRLFPNPFQHTLDVDILQVDDEVAGLVKMSPSGPGNRRWNVDFVAVANEYRGKGLGKMLLTESMNRRLPLGAKCFTLEVEVENERAIRMYEKLGYREYAKVWYFKKRLHPTSAITTSPSSSQHPHPPGRSPSDVDIDVAPPHIATLTAASSSSSSSSPSSASFPTDDITPTSGASGDAPVGVVGLSGVEGAMGRAAVGASGSGMVGGPRQRDVMTRVGVKLDGLRPFDAASEHQANQVYELYKNATPPFVSWVEGISASSFQLNWLGRLLTHLRRKLKQVDDHRLIVIRNQKALAYVRVMAQLRPGVPHTMQLIVDPEWPELYPPLLAHVETLLRSLSPPSPSPPVILTWARDNQLSKCAALKSWGASPSGEYSLMVRGTSPHPLSPDLWSENTGSGASSTSPSTTTIKLASSPRS